MLTFKSLINIVFFIITWATQSFIEYALSLDILDGKELELDYANLFPVLQGQEHSTIHNTVLQPYSSKEEASFVQQGNSSYLLLS